MRPSLVVSVRQVRTTRGSLVNGFFAPDTTPSPTPTTPPTMLPPTTPTPVPTLWPIAGPTWLGFVADLPSVVEQPDIKAASPERPATIQTERMEICIG